MNTDHNGICKFDDAEDQGYNRIKNRVLELVRKAPDIIEARFKSGSVPT